MRVAVAALTDAGLAEIRLAKVAEFSIYQDDGPCGIAGSGGE
jgi:hypothetical protein